MVTSELMTSFLLSSQQETKGEVKQEVQLSVYTSNNCKITVNVYTTDRSEQVLVKVCRQMNLTPEFTYHFALFIIRRECDGDVTIMHKLQDFESPYISHRAIKESNMIVIRKSYWELDYDLEIIEDPVALNLLYTQAVSDMERGWILCTKEVKSQLAHLQARLAKREYIDLSRTLKYYGYVHFQPCHCDYPKPETPILVAIGNQELSVRLMGRVIKEGCFKVTRMRCWRITAIHVSNTNKSINP